MSEPALPARARVVVIGAAVLALVAWNAREYLVYRNMISAFESAPSFRADSPDQASFLACVEEASQLVGYYGGSLGSPGRAHEVRVRVVERRSGAVSRTYSLYYSPPDSIRSDANKRTAGDAGDFDMIPVDGGLVAGGECRMAGRSARV